MEEGGDVKSHVNKFKQCVSKLLRIDVKKQDDDQTMILLFPYLILMLYCCLHYL